MADPTTVYWMAEFLLRERTISDDLASALFGALPSPSASASSSAAPSVRRAILLRGLSSDLSRPRFSPRTLRLIELLQHHNARSNPLASNAYLSVATYIVTSAPDFASAVSSIFLRRIGGILKFPDASGLASDRMKTVAEEMAAALTDPVLRAEMVGRNTLKEAMEAVRDFLEKEREEMELQPCFLETAAQMSECFIQLFYEIFCFVICYL
ncbi:hypothetical protein FCM35_KLT18606 [Carex littledalei]|uniref:Uncharacterized protein n=1 Tax=Carex littledalei TaxID=544730 RepID=A0A833RAP5_9POAL|nr:hypothetical protein FCM35_KLT18606 [Carex littledalei]